MVVTATLGSDGQNTSAALVVKLVNICVRGRGCHDVTSQPLRKFVLLPCLNKQLATFVILTGIVPKLDGTLTKEFLRVYEIVKRILH
jgi:hypothetical protein